ncbi:hypothetical protein MASR1M46_02640 [Bacteroidales bacterium]
MRLLVNPKDDEAFRRVVNVPGYQMRRKELAAAAGRPLSMGGLSPAILMPFGIKPAAACLFNICCFIAEVGSKASTATAYDITMEILMRSGYMEHLRADSSLEGQARLENVEELFNSIKEMEGELSGGEISAVNISDANISIGNMIADEDPGLYAGESPTASSGGVSGEDLSYECCG